MDMILLKDSSGNMVCVSKPDNWDNNVETLGYSGWTVLTTQVGPPPDYASWVDGQGWVVDEDAKIVGEEVARLASMTGIERQQEAIATATNNLLAALLDAGVITQVQASNVTATLPE